MATEIHFGQRRPKFRFYRSSSGVFAGVCKGLAESFQFNTNMVRLLWVLGVIYSFGLVIPAYIIFGLFWPREDRFDEAYDSMLFGVCGRISKKMIWEVGLVRSAAVVLTLMSLGLGLLIYVIAYFSFDTSNSSGQ